jgi:hypothetical protein
MTSVPQKGGVMDRQHLLQIVLWLIALYHVLMGFGAALSDRVAESLAASVFGIRLRLTPQASYLVKLLGVYTVVFGVIVMRAAVDPGRYPALLDGVVVLYILRILNRIVHRKLYIEAFETTDPRVRTDIAMLALFGAAVLILKP